MSVYFIKDEHGWVKIGVSDKPKKRLLALQTSHADKLTIIRMIEVDGDDYQTEEWLHRRFIDRRIRGEWFHHDPEMLTIIPPDTFDIPPPSEQGQLSNSPDETLPEDEVVSTGVYQHYRRLDALDMVDVLERLELIEIGRYSLAAYEFLLGCDAPITPTENQDEVEGATS